MNSLNTYIKNIVNHERFFLESTGNPETISALATLFLFDKENNFEVPMEIKNLILEKILDLKYRDFDTRILDLSARIYEKLIASKDYSIDLDNDDVLDGSIKIFSDFPINNKTVSLCFMTDQKPDKKAKDADALFPIKTRVALAHVENVITVTFKTKQLCDIFLDKTPFLKLAEGIALPKY